MNLRAEVVIVGGGVMGTSIAWHLARAGVRDVVLVERDELAAGSTSRAAGGVRAQFSDELNIQLGARSLEAFGRFEEEVGQDIGLHRVGYLFLLSTPEQVASFEAGVRLQNSLGVPSRLISPQEARRLSPLIRTDGLLAAAYSPDDGHCTPEAVVHGYARAARAHGARILRHTEATGIELHGDTITAVSTTLGRIETGTVICAAGAWSRAVGAMAGVELPVRPLRRQIAVTAPVPGLPPALPMTIDFTTSLYFHREGPGLLLGMSDPDERPGFATDTHDRWIPRLAEAMQQRAPALLELRRTGGWAGLYENTPDHNALIGEASTVSRFLYATGFSGHGFLQGPAVGEIVRDLYLGRVPFLDISPLSAGRFAADAPRPEANLV
ncbi:MULTISPECIES: NAD(P)/FAD-dependent oxidoreductase [Streptomyces]|uniref:FAD-binding oxidoreductase n=2 Tax=Streptomyces TaxID=1883 RepID=A0ABS9JPK8_9ACTN|nr:MULTISPECIES: FAD-binding oxidoreductase [Streptomyces]MYU31331.1 FAD-dependent oxidoreductase [Streptomyces sp. SID7810]CUW32442.1 4-methylaminobutanoate oxidase (formaldehyde-forming) [Streptomyces reticuli]MCG0067524.1 FAD-binding oxidoreductase [Streptomyces tricolor]OYP14229.1 FAD-binding oxidoreductase [Streptomyces sp. FBKL.4005]BCM70751.1 putative sarcosine oxidase subunit beta [Streptomyces sp. EAS-AB2608]